MSCTRHYGHSSLKCPPCDIEFLESSLAAAKAEIEKLTKAIESVRDILSIPIDARLSLERTMEARELCMAALSQGEAVDVSELPEMWQGAGISSLDEKSKAFFKKYVGSLKIPNYAKEDQEAHDREVRNRALEEAARVADFHYIHFGIGETGKAIAGKIRTLISEPSKGQGEIPK